jgi:PAS domain S-box-containing protein
MAAEPESPRGGPPGMREVALAAFEQAPVATAVVEFVAGARPTVVQANQAFCALTGRARDDVVGQRFTRIVAGVDDVLAGLAGGTAVREVPGRCLRADGTSVNIALHGSMLKTRTDPRVLAVLQAIPLTTQLFGVLGRGETETRVQDFVDHIEAMIYVKDADGRYLMTNRHFERMLGVPREKLRSKVDFDLFPPDMAAMYVQNDRQILASRVSTYFEEPLARSGTSWLSLKFPIFDQDGMPYAVGGISANISDRSRAEAATRQAKDEAERASRAKSEFLSRMSHELRTPLNSILGFGQLLQMEQLPIGSAESVDRIVQAGRHLLALINEVLEISRIEAGAHDLSLASVHACEPLADALNMVRPLADARRIELVEDLHGGLYRYVLADHRQLMQVLLNILANAVKYNEEGGTVSVSMEAISSGRLRFRISDTGHGIDERDVDRVFVPFERLTAAESDAEGTGLGLAVSKAIIDALGGAIGVEHSSEGRGTAFFVDLPLTDGPVSAPDPFLTEDAAASALVPGMADVTVLYIEDNAANVELLRRVLARVGTHKFIAAREGRLGVELATQHAPDLIVLDLHLHDLHGEEVLRRLLADPRTRDIPVMVLSADATPSRVQRAKTCGAEAYLTKPLDIPEFIQAVQQILGAGRP